MSLSRKILSATLSAAFMAALASMAPGSAMAACSACVNAITLPGTPVSNSGIATTTNTAVLASTGQGLLAVTLTGIASGTTLTNQTYTGWCGSWYSAVVLNNAPTGFPVYSTYSSSFPSGDNPIVAGNNFNMVNYILNNKGALTIKDVQDAIWLTVTGETESPASTAAVQLAATAKANPNYIPDALGVVGVFYQIGPTQLPTNVTDGGGQYQSILIEVKVPSIGGDVICASCVSSLLVPPAVQYSSATKNSSAATQLASTGAGKATTATIGVAVGYNLTNKSYPTWFGGWWTSTLPSSGYSGFPAYSSYASTYPAAYKPLVSGNTMNMVNYILNNKQGTVQDVQNAISMIMLGSSETALSVAAQAMYDAAKLKSTYCPPAGGIIAVVVATSSTPIAANSTAACNQSQTLIIETVCGAPTTSGTPGLSLKKTASKTKVVPFEKVTYTYVVTNTGSLPLTNVVVVDDNATPAVTSDDFTVGTVASLLPGASATLTASIYPPVQENAETDDDDWHRGYDDDDDSDSGYHNSNHWGSSHDWDNDNDQYTGGLVTVKELPNGNIQFTYRQDNGLADTSYGRGSSSSWGYSGRNFQSVANYDGAQFQILDKQGNVCLDFVADYVSQNSKMKSGYGTLGVKGGGGGVYKGNSAHILRVDTSLSKNLNRQSKYNQCTKDSPSPNTTDDWDDDQTYTVTIDKAACAKYGFGGVKVPKVKNYKSKQRNCENHVVHPTSSSATNTATASVLVNGTTVKATAKATVTVDASSRGWSQCSKY